MGRWQARGGTGSNGRPGPACQGQLSYVCFGPTAGGPSLFVDHTRRRRSDPGPATGTRPFRVQKDPCAFLTARRSVGPPPGTGVRMTRVGGSTPGEVPGRGSGTFPFRQSDTRDKRPSPYPWASYRESVDHSPDSWEVGSGTSIERTLRCSPGYRWRNMVDRGRSDEETGGEERTEKLSPVAPVSLRAGTEGYRG